MATGCSIKDGRASEGGCKWIPETHFWDPGAQTKGLGAIGEEGVCYYRAVFSC